MSFRPEIGTVRKSSDSSDPGSGKSSIKPWLDPIAPGIVKRTVAFRSDASARFGRDNSAGHLDIRKEVSLCAPAARPRRG
jgi:hypothetical protein